MDDRLRRCRRRRLSGVPGGGWRGLVNQGWKDSADGIRFRDGRIAEGPIALCEVQGYAYEAAMGGAALLEAFDRVGADQYRLWAKDLATRFRARFWCEQGDDRYPAIALDGAKRRVDSLTSNIGHLLGTGMLSGDEELLIARLITSPALDSGLGLRTMATTDAGYAPLSYHCGSVWPHDTAIVIAGLVRAGLADSLPGSRRSAARIGCLRATATRAVERRRPTGSLSGRMPTPSMVGRLRDSRCPRARCPLTQGLMIQHMADNSIKTALVTGASSGIGEATALQLAELGYTVYAAARRVERMSDLADRGIRTTPSMSPTTPSMVRAGRDDHRRDADGSTCS